VPSDLILERLHPNGLGPNRAGIDDQRDAARLQSVSRAIPDLEQDGSVDRRADRRAVNPKNERISIVERPAETLLGEHGLGVAPADQAYAAAVLYGAPKLTFGKAGDRGGAVGRPELDIKGISRTLGTVGATSIDLPRTLADASDVPKAVGYVPPADRDKRQKAAEFFNDDAKLLGLVKLKDIITALLGTGGSVRAAARGSATPRCGENRGRALRSAWKSEFTDLARTCNSRFDCKTPECAEPDAEHLEQWPEPAIARRRLGMEHLRHCQRGQYPRQAFQLLRRCPQRRPIGPSNWTPS